METAVFIKLKERLAKRQKLQEEIAGLYAQVKKLEVQRQLTKRPDTFNECNRNIMELKARIAKLDREMKAA